MLSRYFVDRPIFAWVLAILVMIGGGIAIFSMGVEQFPDIAPPTISVQANYPGADARTVEKGDLNPSEVRGGLDKPDRATMCGFNLAHSDRHRWYYAPRMRPDEIYAFKLCDSDTGRVQWTGHTSFDDPTSPADARPRQRLIRERKTKSS